MSDTLSTLRALEAAATPGKWQSRHGGEPGCITAGYTAAPLLARWENADSYYYAVGKLVFLFADGEPLIKRTLTTQLAHRLAARLNAMRCREVAS